MVKIIEIPDDFADLIESCERVRAGQTRKYGPYEEVFHIKLKGEYDEARVLAFCQKCCHECKYTENQLSEIKANRDLSSNEMMEAIVEGSYTLRQDYIDKKEVTYKWSQDYLD